MVDQSRLDDLRRRVQKDPASIAFAQLGEELRRANQLDESIAICRAGLALHPTYSSARVTLGRALFAAGRLDEAETELAAALKGSPDNLSALRAIGEIYHRQGRLDDALAHFQAALAIARNDPDLQQTVATLAQRIPPPPPALPSASATGPMPAASAAAPRKREQLTIEALERWLDAIQLARHTRQS